MDLELSDEQRLLRDSVGRMLAAPDGSVAAVWQRCAELGLLGLPFAEQDGGFGGGAVETMLVMEALGRSQAVAPYLSAIVLGGGLVRLGGSAAQRGQFVPRIAEGSLRLAFAHVERQARYDLADVAATARPDGEGFVLNGQKSVVLDGDSAGLLAVSARIDGGRRDRDGIGVFLVEPATPGVSRHGYATQDGRRAAEIALAEVRVPLGHVLGDPAAGLALIEHVVDTALAAIAAEAVGAMDALLETTVDYLRQRRQFGLPLGSFQALQHRAADMKVAVEQARSMAMYAAMMADAADARERRTAVAAAKVQVNQSARLIGQEAIQLHGGIAVTADYKVGGYVKRLTMLESLFGDTEHHLACVAAADGLPDSP